MSNAESGPPRTEPHRRRVEDRNTNETTRTTRGSHLEGLPERLGPCRLVRPLGAGGMGTVYLAEMVEHRPYGDIGTSVAVKILHPELVHSADIYGRFLREGRLGTALDHPSVIRTHESAEASIAGRRIAFLVLEYAEGQTLRELFEDVHVLPEPQLRVLGASIARGLAAIHAAGAVHRDLKPPNVLVTRDSNVKLMDLGVAYLLDEGAKLTTTGDFVGTLHYAAPEQFRGERVGPAADMYSLGLMLYEGATGSQPFAADEFASVMRRHLELVPPRARQVNPVITPFLDELLAQLLDKTPSHRVATAVELATILEEGESSEWWRARAEGRASSMPSAARKHLAIGRTTSLVGRERELRELRSCLASARCGDGSFVLVSGQPGIGKSRLIDELLATLEGESSDLAVLAGTTPAGSSIAGAIGDALVAHLGASSLEAELSRLLPGSPQLANATAAILSGAPGVDSGAGLEALRATVEHLARTLATDRTVIWIAEDVHRSSPDAMSLVVALGRLARGRRMLVIATSRPQLSAEAAAAFDSLDGSRRIELGRLSNAEVETLLQERLQGPLAERLAPRIAARAGGNPLFALASVDQLEREQALRRRADGSLEPVRDIRHLEVPSAVKGILLGRVEALNTDLRKLLDVAAVHGPIFDADLVARVLQRDRLNVLQDLAQLERSGLIVSSGDLFAFDHAALQEVLQHALPPVLRSEYHGRLADAFRKRSEAGAGDVAEASAFLARHDLLAGRKVEGARLAPQAITHAMAQGDLDSALELADLALKAIGSSDPARRCEIRLLQAHVLERSGQREAARVAVQDALSAAERAGDAASVARARGGLGRLLALSGNLAAGLEELRACREGARAVGDAHTDALATAVAGEIHDALGDRAGAVTRLEQAAHSLAQLGDAPAALHAEVALAIAIRRCGRFDEAQEKMEAALFKARHQGDVRAEIDAMDALGDLLRTRGSYSRAREHHDRALGLSRQTPDRRASAHARIGLARTALALGELLASSEHVDTSVGCAREAGDRLAEVEALALRAVVSVYLGRLDDGVRDATEAMSQAIAIGSSPLEAIALEATAEVALAQGDVATARDTANRALERNRSIVDNEGIARASLLVARAWLIATGDDASAIRDPEDAASVATRATVRAHLLESERVSRELGLGECHAHAATLLAVIGERPLTSVELDDAPAVARLMSHTALADANRAGRETAHHDAARALIQRMTNGLEPEELSLFRAFSPLALRR